VKEFTVFLYVVLLLFGTATTGRTLVIDFDDLEEAGTGAGVLASYSDGDFVFSSAPENLSAFGYWQQSNDYYNTSAALFNNYFGETILSTSSGNLFTIDSIDLDLLYLDGEANVHFYAYDKDDVEVADLDIDLTTDGWQTLSFGQDFQNIAYLKWQQTSSYHQFDNVNATPVPEPATMLLLGSGLIGLAGFSKKKFKK
jgi:hypothetical protein